MQTYIISDVWTSAKKIFGSCNESALYERLTEGVEVLANTGDFDPLFRFVDICVEGRCVTLPREVGTPLGINIGGRPTVARDKMFRFHRNGWGDCKTECTWDWDDYGLACTYRDIGSPSKLVAWLEHEEDEGIDVRVFGYTPQQTPVRSQVNGVWRDGYSLPTIFGWGLPDSGAPTFARITKVVKAVSTGPVRIATFDLGSTTGTAIGVYEADETVPAYRRIKLGRDTNWIRVAYRARLLKLASQEDILPVPSRVGYLMMLRALKAYDEGDVALGTNYEATARRYTVEAQMQQSPPGSMPVQVNPEPSITGAEEYGYDDID